MISNPPLVKQGDRPAAALRWTMTSLAMCMLLPSMGISIANVGLPAVARAFNASVTQVQWVLLGYLLATTSLVVTVGRLGDLTNRRRLLLAGIGLFTLASIGAGLAPTLGWLIAARVAQGTGAATMMALTMALVGESIPKENAGSAMGLLGTMSAVGTALGPSLGGVMLASFGWPGLFFACGALGILALLLAWRVLPRSQRTTTTRSPGLDAASPLLLAATLAAYTLAVTWGSGRFTLLNVALLVAAALGMTLFVRVQSKAAFPLVPLALFHDSLRWSRLLMNALVSTVIMATLVVGPFYLARALGLHTTQVGVVLSVGPVVSALCGVPAGRWADRWGTQRMTSAGLLVMALGCFFLAALPVSFGVPGYIGAVATITAGYAVFQAANNAGFMALSAPEERGVMSGVLNLSRNLGLISGASAMGTVFMLGTSTAHVMAASTEAVAIGMRITFAVAAALVVTAWCATRLGHRRSRYK